MEQEIERCPISTEEVLKELEVAREEGVLEKKLVWLYKGLCGRRPDCGGLNQAL